MCVISVCFLSIKQLFPFVLMCLNVHTVHLSVSNLFYTPPQTKFLYTPANEVAGVYSDPYVRSFVRPFVRPSVPPNL